MACRLAPWLLWAVLRNMSCDQVCTSSVRVKAGSEAAGRVASRRVHSLTGVLVCAAQEVPIKGIRSRHELVGTLLAIIAEGTLPCAVPQPSADCTCSMMLAFLLHGSHRDES